MAYNQPPHNGAADSYYSQQGQQNIGLQSPPPQYHNQGEGPYQQQYPPPNQQVNGQPYQNGVNEKVGFEQQFKLDKPKFNDLWAALLFIATFLGFVAVSGLSLYGYSHTKGQQGSGIRGGDTFTLNTGTIILL
jgi:hypothetical protein